MTAGADDDYSAADYKAMQADVEFNIYRNFGQNEQVTRLCRDEDCPDCGWPETYTEVCFTDVSPTARAVGCGHCGWRVFQW